MQSHDGSEQAVMEIRSPTRRDTGFYFGFVTNFRLFVRDYFVQHASLTVFRDMYAGVPSALFRAEWDESAASDSKSKHAQPHWHFVQRPEQIEALVRSLYEPPNEDFNPGQKSELFGALADSSKFHFAMISLWDKNKHVFQSDDFQKWFKELTGHIAGQIDYIVSRAPAPATVPKDFVPDEVEIQK